MSQYSEDGIVDVEERTKEVGKILNDPTLFPVEFLSWIKRFIEQSGISLPVSSIIGGFQPGSGSVRNLAAGIILPYGGPTAPQGALACHGTSHSRTEYGLLFAEIGVTWGSDSADTFKVPDFRDRAIFGAGAYIGVGATDGQAYGQRHGPVHGHPVDAHGHILGRQVVGLVYVVHDGVSYSSANYSIIGNQESHDVGTDAAGSQAGPGAGYHQNQFNWAGVLPIITTGQ